MQAASEWQVTFVSFFVRMFLYEVNKHKLLYTYSSEPQTFVKFNDILKTSEATAAKSNKQKLLVFEETHKESKYMLFC